MRVLLVTACLLLSCGCLLPPTTAITVSTSRVRRPLPLHQISRVHRSGVPPVYRVRSVPATVKRIYVPMKVLPARYPPPGAAPVYKRGPPHPPPPQWNQHKHIPQPFYPPQNYGPPRKVRNPKPKYILKQHHKYSPKYIEKSPYDSYKPHPVYNSPYGSGSYGAHKIYKIPGTTYGKPVSETDMKKDESSATSYIHVYQGERAKEEGKPTYSFSQTHSYENQQKESLFDSETALSNHRPVYKHKTSEDTSSTTTELNSQGSFQPPKQTYGFQPYQETGVSAASSEQMSVSPTHYYKKQPDSVLSPNYFDQNKS